MESITVALVQHASPVGHKAANLERTVALARGAAAQGATLVAFPELGITGHAATVPWWRRRKRCPTACLSPVDRAGHRAGRHDLRRDRRG